MLSSIESAPPASAAVMEAAANSFRILDRATALGNRVVTRRPYLVTVDGIGRAKPTAVRAKALRTCGWWNRRCPGLDVALVRLPAVPA